MCSARITSVDTVNIVSSFLDCVQSLMLENKNGWMHNLQRWLTFYMQPLEVKVNKEQLRMRAAWNVPSHSSFTSSSVWLRITSWPWNLKYPKNFFFCSIRGNQRTSSGHIWLKGIWWHSNHCGFISAKQENVNMKHQSENVAEGSQAPGVKRKNNPSHFCQPSAAL